MTDNEKRLFDALRQMLDMFYLSPDLHTTFSKQDTAEEAFELLEELREEWYAKPTKEEKKRLAEQCRKTLEVIRDQTPST